MNQPKDVLALLGHEVQDRITGFKGTVTGVALYLAGCHQACIYPKVDVNGKLVEATWLDCARLEVVSTSPVQLPGGAVVAGTGGDGPQAPRR